MTCSQGCGRPAQIRGMCKGHYTTNRKRQVRLGQWTPRVPSIGSTRRLRALVALGYPQVELAALLDTHQSWVSKLLDNPRQHVNPATAARIAALYDRLSMTPGPSDRARAGARRKGWAPPLAWDDDTIDDADARPDGQPSSKGRKTIPFDEKYGELRALGYTDFQILRKLDIKPESLLRQLNRYGINASPALVTHVSTIKHKRTRAAS